MEHLFVTDSDRLMDRWQQAFPRARILSEPSEIVATGFADKAVIWLDISGLNHETKLQSIQDTSALGGPVVAMAASPDEAEAFQALNAGAAGYCHIKAAHEQLREIGLVVEHGGIWMPPELMQRLLKLS